MVDPNQPAGAGAIAEQCARNPSRLRADYKFVGLFASAGRWRIQQQHCEDGLALGQRRHEIGVLMACGLVREIFAA